MAAPLTCPACTGVAFRPVLAVERLPVFCNVLHDTAGAARGAPVGAVQLVQCEGCGMIVNAAFDPERTAYQLGYENSLHHSPTFQAWARGLAARLVERHRLEGGTAIELGSGSGGFLSLLCEAGMARGIGYDPSYGGEPDPTIEHLDGLEVHAEPFDPRQAPSADLALARHVLEHVTSPIELVELLHAAAPRGAVYVEVPDAATMLAARGVYDVIYEHCSYFTAPAIRALLARGGLVAEDVRTEFGGQYLAAEAWPGEPRDGVDDHELAQVLAEGEAFGADVPVLLDRGADRLADLGVEERDVVVWGAGSKGVTFVNLVPGGGSVSRLVDLNPRKHGLHVPVTAQPVVAPADLRHDPPDAVVVVNPLYRDEVEARLRDLDLRPEVVVA